MTELDIGEPVAADRGAAAEAADDGASTLALGWRDLRVSLDRLADVAAARNERHPPALSPVAPRAVLDHAGDGDHHHLAGVALRLSVQTAAGPDYLPYLGTSFVVWGLLSSIVLDSCTVFISSEGFLRQVPLPKSVFVYRMLVRNVVIFVHNIIISAADLPDLRRAAGLDRCCSPASGVGGGPAQRDLDRPSARHRLCALPRYASDHRQPDAGRVFYLTPVMWRPSQLPQRKNGAGFSAAQPVSKLSRHIVREPLAGPHARRL
jgi:hypothetical protein